MSLPKILEELPAFSVAERQFLVRRLIEMDEPGLSPAEEELIKSRLADHDRNPASATSFEAMKYLRAC